MSSSNNRLVGQVEVAFIMGGISPKNKKPYLQVSNGRESFFVKIPKSLHDSIDQDTFAAYEEDDVISLEVSQLVGSETVVLVSIVD